MPTAARRRRSPTPRPEPAGRSPRARSVPSPARSARPAAPPRSSGWRRRLGGALAAALCFGLGSVAPQLPGLLGGDGASVAASSVDRSALPKATRRTFPREAAELRLELDRSASPATTVELIERLGILGDPSDFERLADLAEHPNQNVGHAALRAMARIGGERSLDRLTVLARSHDDMVAVAAIGALGLAESAKAVDVLLEVADSRIDWRQGIALQALAVRGGARARAALHEGLKEAPANGAYSWAQAVASLGEPADRFLLMTLAGGNGPRADAALSALAGLGSADSDSLLIELAESATGNRRLTALASLGSVRDARAVEVLVAALDGNINVRSAALSALGMSKAPGALDGLLLAIDGARVDEAWQITGALAARPERQAREVLKLLAAEDGALADAALASLAQTGDPAAGALLVAAFDERGELPPESTYHFLAVHGGEDGWSLLEEVLADGSTAEQHSVVYALQARGDEDAITRLLDVARGEDPWISSSAMGALENLGDEARTSLRTMLLERMEDGDDTGFAEAAPTLARLGGDDVRELLVSRLADGTAQERNHALQALGQMDDAGARAALQETLASEDPELRRQAFDALVWSGQPLDFDTVNAMLDDEDPGLRSQAVSALANIGEPVAVERLMQLAGDEDPSVRMSAVSAMGTVGGADAEAGLLAAMEDPELFDTALWSLSGMGTSSAREAIREAATAGEPAQRMTALSALGNDRSAQSREILVGALHAEDPGVVSTALGQLQMQGSSTAASAVLELLMELPEDDDPMNLRWSAANALQSIGGRTAREHQELIDSVLQGMDWGEEEVWGPEVHGWQTPPELYIE